MQHFKNQTFKNRNYLNEFTKRIKKQTFQCMVCQFWIGIEWETRNGNYAEPDGTLEKIKLFKTWTLWFNFGIIFNRDDFNI